jgi:hypothetical protein
MLQVRKKYFAGKIHRPFLQVSPASLLDVSDDNCQGALAEESGMIRKQMGMYNRSEMVAVQWVTLCTNLTWIKDIKYG